MLPTGARILICVLYLGTVSSAPTDEFKAFANYGDIFSDENWFLKPIVPVGLSSISSKSGEFYIKHKDNEYYKILKYHLEKGTFQKDLTFNIYDDNIREATIALFRLFQTVDDEDFKNVLQWTLNNVNNGMKTYVLKLTYLYTNTLGKKFNMPPFVTNPNHFVNGETIIKALRLNGIRTGPLNLQESNNNQVFESNGAIVINSNYSGWNLLENGGDEELNYFREDVHLNSYYYGIHLMHPFWMSNDELDEINARHAEHYYYEHQQLMARYLLEKQHLTKNGNLTSQGDNNFNPYLLYQNGLPFPVRSAYRGEWNDGMAKIKLVDIGIKECISRGIIFMENGTSSSMTDDTHIELLAKIIRANLDGVKISKIVRSLFGYGGNGYPVDQYNPAPSVLHHPDTSLRDPVYWYLVQYVLNYFTEFKNTMEPFELSQYETDEISIIGNDFGRITTYFDNYEFNINGIYTNNPYSAYQDRPYNVKARQRRLKHLPFTLNFTVEAKSERNVIVRLFLGPECSDNCWKDYSKFYELDCYKYFLNIGTNMISWSTETSIKYSSDDNLNTNIPISSAKQYEMFKFPKSLVIPRGLEEGLKATLFIMIIPAEDTYQTQLSLDSVLYQELSYEVDSKPLGFPFQREAVGYKSNATNYRFYNISIYHKQNSMDDSGYFSPHLY